MMYSNIQSYQRKLSNKFWKLDYKRRNSNTNTKHEESIHKTVSSNFNYDISLQEKFVQDYSSRQFELDSIEECKIFNQSSLKLEWKSRVYRTIRKPIIEDWERDNPFLTSFLQSYTSDYLMEHTGRARIITGIRQELITETPIYEIDQDVEPESLREFSANQIRFQPLESVQSDPLIAGLLNYSFTSQTEEAQCTRLRLKQRLDHLFPYYSLNNRKLENQIEIKPQPNHPTEELGRSIRIEIKSMSIEPDMESFFCHMALYDLKNRKKLSEDFYFHKLYSSENVMVKNSNTESGNTRFSNSCIFHTSKAADIFLVIKVEKILQQGDVNEIADAYLRDEKHRTKLKSQIEWSSTFLNRYKMPFGIMALELNKLFKLSSSSSSSIPTKIMSHQSSSSVDISNINSKHSMKGSKLNTSTLKRNTTETVSLRSATQNAMINSSTAPRSLSKDFQSLQSTSSVITSNSNTGILGQNDEETTEFEELYNNIMRSETQVQFLYRWDQDKSSEDDLFKWFLELKRGSTSQKKLKHIPCKIYLDMCTINEMTSSELIINPEGLPISNNYLNVSNSTHDTRDNNSSNQSIPIIDLLEFPFDKKPTPHCTYRNLLYVYPKSVNFSSARLNVRNISLRIQLIHTDGDKMKVLRVIYNHWSNEKFTTEAYTKVLYHNKMPEFNDEIKLKLPAVITEAYFLLFTFSHICCQYNKKSSSNSIENIIGYSWLPLLDSRKIMRSAEHNLMVAPERPTPNIALMKPDLVSNLENVRWLDNHKEIFRVMVQPISSVHSQDNLIENFNRSVAELKHLTELMIAEKEDVDRLRSSILKYSNKFENSESKSIIQFSSILLNNLLWLITNSSDNRNQTSSESANNSSEYNPQYFLRVLANIVNLMSMNSIGCEDTGFKSSKPHINNITLHRNFNRSYYLSSYLYYSMCIPVFDRSIMNPNLKRKESTASNSSAISHGTKNNCHFYYIFLQVLMEGLIKGNSEVYIENLWFYMDILVHSMKEYYMHQQTPSTPLDSPLLHQLLQKPLPLTQHKTLVVFSDEISVQLRQLINLSIEHIDKYIFNATKEVSHAENESLFSIHLTNKKFKNAQYLTRNLGLFCCDLISLFNVTFVKSIIMDFIGHINSQISVSCNSLAMKFYILVKLEYLRIICCNEFFPNLSGIFRNKNDATEGDYNVLNLEEPPFLVGLLLNEVSLALNTNISEVQSEASYLMWNILHNHESDKQHHLSNQQHVFYAKISEVYLPFLSILYKLIDVNAIGTNSTVQSRTKMTPTLSYNSRNIQVVDKRSASFRLQSSMSLDQDNLSLSSFDNYQLSNEVWDFVDKDNRKQSSSSLISGSKCPFAVSDENSRYLLLCVLWILRNIEKQKLVLYLQTLSHDHNGSRHNRSSYSVDGEGDYGNDDLLKKLLYLLLWAVNSFEYKGNSEIHSSKLDNSFKKGLANKSTENTERLLYSKLCTEAVFIVLDTLDIILKIFDKSSNAKFITMYVFDIIIKIISLNQSVPVLQSTLAFQRLLVKKHCNLVFDEAVAISAQLCSCLLNLMGSCMKEVRAHAEASLYMLMRYNFQHENTFARVKLQLTTALSRSVCHNRNSLYEQQSKLGQTQNSNKSQLNCSFQLNLKRALRTILAYTNVENELSVQNQLNGLNNGVCRHNNLEGDCAGSNDEGGDKDDIKHNINDDISRCTYSSLQTQQFTTQVTELIHNLHNILSDTLNMRLYEEGSMDIEMQMNLMARIAKGYQNSPDLRLEWLQLMKEKYKENHNECEAAMCLAHCTALISEYLPMKEPANHLPIGCVTLAESLSNQNFLEESAISDDCVTPGTDICCDDSIFSEAGLLDFCKQTARQLVLAELYETIPSFYKQIAIPILEKNRETEQLATIYGEIKSAYDKIKSSKRIFSTYFRVSFFGSKFEELNGQQFIHKEPPFTKLPEISQKLENFYSTRFGKDKLVIVKDSNDVDVDQLELNKMYIQITYVEPYFEFSELGRRKTEFERNYNIRKFVFSTPYTLSGKAHGEIANQYKRKTILYTAKSFPYIQSRLRVVNKRQIELVPIEVALEDLTKKVDQLSVALNRKPIDVKYLQMMLQGSIGTTVNQGPLELAQTFLSTNDTRSLGVHYNKLKLCFKQFLRRCRECLEKNKSLITQEQMEYHKELEKNYHYLNDQLVPLLQFKS